MRITNTIGVAILLFAASTAIAQNNPIFKTANVSVSSNGKFIHRSLVDNSRANSENGVFWCQYDIESVGDEIRVLNNFRFFQNSRLLFSLERVPGSDLYISNSGIVAFMDTKHHYKGELTINFYSKHGQHLLSETYTGAALFGFSSEGNRFGVGTARQLSLISFSDRSVETYPACDQFDISEDENLVATAKGNWVRVYSNGKFQNEYNTGFIYPRDIKISSKHNYIAVIDKRNLKVYSFTDNDLIFADKLTGGYSYRELMLNDGNILAGIHYRYNGISKGILKAYSRSGEINSEREVSITKYQTFDKPACQDNAITDYPEIPWPFFPFDSMCTVWNYYEQHMSYGDPDWSYLHQGLDMITPIAEPTYAVAPGIVKCVLSIGGPAYWRVAVSPEQSPGWSRGWLYAHLIENTIQVDVGDTIEVHDYLGDIIEWHEEWGHIHFVEIEDSGLVWRYDDNEWGINYNPLLSLRPDTDLIPPVIEDVFEDSKFAFCINETNTYIDPDSLYGDIDIIAKVSDYIGDSEWEQPAYETFYWVKKLPGGAVVFPRTLGHILNHEYDFYNSGHYEPYAVTIYKRDSLLVPSPWMDIDRNYYHVLTNSNGDSLIDPSEKELAFSTSNYLDGSYRIFVEVFDVYGNSDLDSMDVQFRNNITGLSIFMIPDDAPVEVLAGESFTFTGILQNNTGVHQAGDIWIMLRLPGGSIFGPIQQFYNIQLGPEQTISVQNIEQQIPAYAPLGTYDYIAYCGNYPSIIVDSSSFEFTVTAFTGVGGDNWNVSGWFDDKTENSPSRFIISSNYPNPFNAKTNIVVSVSSPTHGKLEIYNLLGQKIEMLLNGQLDAGQRTIKWDASGFSSGIYFYKLTAGKKVLIKKMILLR